MRVKVNGRWYDSNNVPVVVQITETEQQTIGSMEIATEGKFGSFPDDMHNDEIMEYMKD